MIINFYAHIKWEYIGENFALDSVLINFEHSKFNSIIRVTYRTLDSSQPQKQLL